MKVKTFSIFLRIAEMLFYSNILHLHEDLNLGKVNMKICTTLVTSSPTHVLRNKRFDILFFEGVVKSISDTLF